MATQTLNRIGVFSAGKVFGTLYAAIGLLIGIPFALISVLGGAANLAGDGAGEAAVFSLFFGVGAVLFFPLFYGIIGFLGAIISAFLYNFLAGLMGGLELDLS